MNTSLKSNVCLRPKPNTNYSNVINDNPKLEVATALLNYPKESSSFVFVELKDVSSFLVSTGYCLI